MRRRLLRGTRFVVKGKMTNRFMLKEHQMKDKKKMAKKVVKKNAVKKAVVVEKAVKKAKK